MNAQNPTASPILLREHFARLLNDFEELRKRADAAEQLDAAKTHESIRVLLAEYKEKVDRYRRQQEQVADDFNLLDVLGLTHKEIRHSMMLAWLLDHDLRRFGTHAQGPLGFRLFLRELSDFNLPLDYADCKYWVRREVAGDESIVDIEIACRGQFLIHIENKIGSGEGAVQTHREWSDLERRAAHLDVNKRNRHAFFLTPKGSKPANHNFHAIRWSRIALVLEEFANRAKPAHVKLFAAHYALALRRFIVVKHFSEDDNAETTAERS